MFSFVWSLFEVFGVNLIKAVTQEFSLTFKLSFYVLHVMYAQIHAYVNVNTYDK